MELSELVPKYLKSLEAHGSSFYTIKNIESALRLFMRYLSKEKITGICELRREVLEEYHEELAFSFTVGGRPLALRTREKRMTVVKGFTKYLKEHDYLTHDPGERIRLPRSRKHLPHTILTAPDVAKLMNSPDTRTNRGYRDRVILEILYDTASRRSEVSGLRLCDIDLEGGYAKVRGKGDKDRVVPVSGRVCALVKNYVLMVRPAFIQGDDPGYLVLNRFGGKMGPNAIWAVVKRSSRLAKIGGKVSTHTLRHTCATHMLKAGAPIRHLQEMLGHESLESTQIYTRVTINDLKEIHTKYHPMSG